MADFEWNPKDVLVLREWDPETKKYTERVPEKKVTYVFKTKDVKFWSKEDVEKYEFQIISFKSKVFLLNKRHAPQSYFPHFVMVGTTNSDRIY